MSTERDFHLHGKTTSQGRNTIQSFVTEALPDAPRHFPAMAPGLLNGFMTTFEQQADSWVKRSNSGTFHCDSVFNDAVSASSWATVACELASSLHWVSRLDYAPEEAEKPLVTQEMHCFARDVNRLLNGMYNLARVLLDTNQTIPPAANSDCLRFQQRQRLQQALYLSELGVGVCCPERYKYHHPDAHKWLALRASCRRALSQAMNEAAQADECLARQWRGTVTD